MTTDQPNRFLRAETDLFVGRRIEIERFLIVAMSGYFPVLLQTGPESLAVVFRTDGPHIGITGTLSMSTSSDGGKSWTDSARITPRWEDARNPAFGISSGRLIVAYWTAVRHAYSADDSGYTWRPKEPEEIGTTAALAVRLSDDHGANWSEPWFYSSDNFVYASPYGRIFELPSGVLGMPIYGRVRHKEPIEIACAILRSHDGGATWGDESMIATDYNETAIVVRNDGSLLAASRSESGRNLATFEGDETGRAWKFINSITRTNEHPADLTVLDSGAMLLTFGRRIRPYGCGALLSRDGGRNWDRSNEALLAGDGAGNSDLGYPSTVQLRNGSICTALYYASGSALSEGDSNWGSVSCQMLRYQESIFGSGDSGAR